MLYAARKAFESAGSRDAAAPLGDRLAEASYQLTDLTADLVRYLEGLDSQPGRLEQIAERRAQLSTLTRKYGTTCDEVLQWAAESAVRLTQLEQSDERIATLTERVEQLSAELSLAAEIGVARREAAARVQRMVLVELAALAMPHARLSFEIASADLGPSGADRVDLMFAANPGNELRSLGRVASGGELSRVRLALEVVLAAGSRGHHPGLRRDRCRASAARSPSRWAAARPTFTAHSGHRRHSPRAGRRFRGSALRGGEGRRWAGHHQRSGPSDEDRAVELARMMAGLDTTDSALAHAGELVELAASSGNLIKLSCEAD